MSRITRWIVADAGLNDAGPLRYLLGKSAHGSRRSLLVHILLAIAYIGILIVGASVAGTASGTPSAVAHQALHLPTVLAQWVISATAFGVTVHTIHTLRRKQTWDSLRATAGGSASAIRAAWAAAVYYRLSGMLGVLIYAPRLVLLGFLLWDLTAFNGDYLTLIAGGHQPAITPPFEVLLLGAYIAAAFVLPLSALGLEAAVGLFFSTFARSRQTATLIHILWAAGRFLWGVLLFFIPFGSQGTSTLPSLAVGSEPSRLVAVLVTGDWGIGTLHAATIDSIWTAGPYTAYIGAGLLAVVLLQSVLTAMILRWAARRAQNTD